MIKYDMMCAHWYINAGGTVLFSGIHQSLLMEVTQVPMKLCYVNLHSLSLHRLFRSYKHIAVSQHLGR